MLADARFFVFCFFPRITSSLIQAWWPNPTLVRPKILRELMLCFIADAAHCRSDRL
jgi:hypothetical protein